MPNCLFQFQKFGVWSHIGGFKVGTDAVLLGAWAKCDNRSSVLDIGAGTGVLSLMVSQRTKACITAIDINEQAALQSAWNFQRSPFGSLCVKQISLQDFARTHAKFDHIICNPPYFQFSSKPELDQMKTAKHTDCLSPDELVTHCASLMAATGKLSLIFPYQDKNDWNGLAMGSGLYPQRMLIVRPFNDVDPKRLLVEYGRIKNEDADVEELILEEGDKHRRVYTQQFREMMKEYYIRF